MLSMLLAGPGNSTDGMGGLYTGTFIIGFIWGIAITFFLTGKNWRALTITILIPICVLFLWAFKIYDGHGNFLENLLVVALVAGIPFSIAAAVGFVISFILTRRSGRPDA